MYGSKLVCQRSHLSLLEGDLRGKVVWITGASTGIGAALAVEAAKYGAKVAISARTHGKLEETKKRCIGREKYFKYFSSEVATVLPEAGYCQGIKEEDILIMPMDMVKFDAHQECLDKVQSHFGKVGSHKKVLFDDLLLYLVLFLSWTL